MNMRDNILILGYFGYITNKIDGQTVKTRNILKLLKMQYPGKCVDLFDIQQLRLNWWSVFSMLRKITKCKRLVYLPSYGNLRFIFPVLFILSVLCRFEIHYFVVGGWLCDHLQRMPIHRWMLRRIKAIHVETQQLASDLITRCDYKNVDVFPNFRFFDCESHDQNADTSVANDIESQFPRLKLAFISRVMKDKGLDVLLELSQKKSSSGGVSPFSIDFYGEMRDDYYSRHLSDVENYTYKGILDPSVIISTIKQYDALIFPTHYSGEGCPGILVEALAAGVPIIASDWKYNSELVVPNENGFLCKFNDVDTYISAISALYNSRKLIADMRIASRRMSIRYSDRYASELIASYFGK
jgi:glycosyltransferase involved in cell wall biosynthesis